MVFRDDNPVREIDNELKVFRKLFKNASEDRSYLIINQAGMISQHIVEYEARLKQKITHNIYNYSFEDFLDECEFFKGPIRDYVLILRDFRNNVPPTDFGKEFGEQFLSFIESFHNFLLLYRNYSFSRPEDSKFGNFRELHRTALFLKRQIENIKENDGKSEINVKPQQNYEDAINEMNHLLKSMLKKQDAHYKVSLDTNQKVNQILEELKKINKDFNDFRELIEDSLEKELPEEEYEKIISKFSNKCVKKIRSSIENEVLTSYECEQIKKDLVETLGKSAWKKLNRQSKRFLITSKITFYSLHELGDEIDYSGVCLLVTKALEVELTKRFYKGFYQYLKENNIPLIEYHTSLVKDDGNGKLTTLPEMNWTLGSIPYILCYKKHHDSNINEKNVYILTEYSKEKLFTESYSDEEIKNILKKYGKEIKDITYRYRNPAAHTNELQCRQAKKCLDYVIDVNHFLKTMLDSFDKEDI